MESKKTSDSRQVIKASKRIMHRISGAFMSETNVRRAMDLLDSVTSATDLKSLSDRLLQLHSSTSERLPYYAHFYRTLFEATGIPSSILDVGCGLNPMSFVYTGLDSPFTYVATDIDQSIVQLVNRYLVIMGCEPRARLEDALHEAPVDRVDIALCLKLLPSLDAQAKGSYGFFLRALQARHVVVSFATTSLGGGHHNRSRHYHRMFDGVLREDFLPIRVYALPTELVYVLENPRWPQAGVTPLGRDEDPRRLPPSLLPSECQYSEDLA